MLSHTDSRTEVTERASSCELAEMSNRAESKRQLLLEIENFQPLSNKLSGYLSNDDLVWVDLDATSARY